MRPTSPSAAHQIGRGASASAGYKLRRQVSAGGNILTGDHWPPARHYGDIRATAQRLAGGGGILPRVSTICTTFSGGMRQRQIARNLVTHPKLVFMDEPAAGWTFPYGPNCGPAARHGGGTGSGVNLYTHDLGVARLLADRLLVMKQGQVVENWVNRPRARRPTSSVYQLPGVVGVAELIFCCTPDARFYRPTERHRLCRMAAAPYPAYGASISACAGWRLCLIGLRSGIALCRMVAMPYPACRRRITCAGWRLCLIRHTTGGIACAGWRLRLIRPTERHWL